MLSARDFGLEVTKTSGSEELVLCPFHSDSTPSAWFNPRKGLFYCAVCALGLNVYQLAKRLGVTGIEMEWLGTEFPEDFALISEPQTFDLGVKMYHPYFKQRNISPETIEEYDVRWSELHQAAAFPLTGVDGRLQGVMYRNTAPDQPRYRLFGTIPLLWPLHKLPNNIKEPLLITEGAFSALRLFDFALGLNFHLNCYALLGAKASERLADMVGGFDCIFLYDSDTAGRRACRRMRELLPLAKSFVLPIAPDDMTDEQIQELIVKLGAKRNK